jgi:hypothetical protein
MINLRTHSVIILGLAIFLIIFTTYSLSHSFSASTLDPLQEVANAPPEQPLEQHPEQPPEPEREPEPPEHIIPNHPTYKPEPISKLPPIVDNFPLAAAAHSSTDLPPIPPWNQPPKPHVPEKTPLFIGFTRNWRLIQQTVISYITAGWPPEDIYVFENTGTMKSNELGLLSLQNPFFLNHTRLEMYGVNIIVTPTLFTFSQLQNFFLWTAIDKNFTTYFWGHMDVVVLSFEDHYVANSVSDHEESYEGFQSIYRLAVDALRKTTSSEPDPNASDPTKPWAARFFAYDRLALVNRAAFESIGGWDTAIPYYYTDCDMHDRLKMYGYEYNEMDVVIGNVSDVANSLDDLLVLYRKKDTVEASFTVEGKMEGEKQKTDTEEKRKDRASLENRLSKQSSRQWVSDVLGSVSYKKLLNVTGEMVKHKNEKGGGGRNTWQSRQTGGKGEPYYRDPEGFEKSIQMTTEAGRQIYAEKWGHHDCGLMQFGRKAGDEWRVEHDWE